MNIKKLGKKIEHSEVLGIGAVVYPPSNFRLFKPEPDIVRLRVVKEDPKAALEVLRGERSKPTTK